MNEPVVSAVKALRPGRKFSFKKDDSGLQRIEAEYLDWLDNVDEPPTVEEIQAEIARQEAEKYKTYRAAEYPTLADFADAMYWNSKGDSSKLNAYNAAVEAVKLKYPKGE